MTDSASKMPERIWTGPELVAATHTWGAHEYSKGGKASVAYIRADIAEQMAEALRPFADYLDEVKIDLNSKGEPLPDDQGVGWIYLTVGDFRRAREAILKARQASTEGNQPEAQINDQ